MFAMAATTLEILEFAPRIFSHRELTPIAVSSESHRERVERLPVQSTAGLLHVADRNRRSARQRSISLSETGAAPNVAAGQAKAFADFIHIRDFAFASCSRPMLVPRLPVGHLERDSERACDAIAPNATLFAEDC